MPILANAKKALRRDRRRTVFNIVTKDKLKLAVKAVKEQKDAKLLPAAYQAIDRTVKKQLMHKNKAARLKSQLSKITKATPKAKTKPAKKAAPKKAAPKKAAPKTTKKASK